MYEKIDGGIVFRRKKCLRKIILLMFQNVLIYYFRDSPLPSMDYLKIRKQKYNKILYYRNELCETMIKIQICIIEVCISFKALF